MNEFFDLWSRPWHVLQRSLAETFNAEMYANVSAGPKVLISQISPHTSGSWLARARGELRVHPLSR